MVTLRRVYGKVAIDGGEGGAYFFRASNHHLSDSDYQGNSTGCHAEQKTCGNHFFLVLLYGGDFKRKWTPYIECMEKLP
jgi:hypothetical protein